VVRYNAEGLCGLHHRPKGHAPQRLTEGEQATLMAVIFKGPDPAKDGVCAWTRADLCRWMEQHLGKSMHPSSLSRVLRRMGLSRQKARPVHPRSDPKAQEQFAKRGSVALEAAGQAHPGKRIQLWFQDETRVGQKGRVCHRWWLKGQRPPGICDKRLEWAYIFTAVQPASGDDVTLVLPAVSTRVMNLFLSHFAQELAPDSHAVVVLDQVCWLWAHALREPDNVTLVPLPSYSPELNAVERVWLYLCERFLSLRVFADQQAIIEACCQAWNALAAENGRLKSLCNQPWIEKSLHRLSGVKS